jgi:hypothetical protein
MTATHMNVATRWFGFAFFYFFYFGEVRPPALT